MYNIERGGVCSSAETWIAEALFSSASPAPRAFCFSFSSLKGCGGLRRIRQIKGSLQALQILNRCLIQNHNQGVIRGLTNPHAEELSVYLLSLGPHLSSPLGDPSR